MRHGETDWNARHLFQGQVNTSLNEKGREQARKARERVRELGLSFDCVYSSPIDRAAQTIEIVTGLDRSQIHLDDRLKEMDFGPLDETPFEKDSPAVGHLFDKPSDYEAPEGADGYGLLQLAGKKRGYLVSGGEVNTERMAKALMDDYRSGKLGKLTLESPEDMQ